MKRKINRVGTNTLTVSLPSDWAKRYGLKQSDEVDVFEEGGTLIVNTKKGVLVKEITVDVSGLNPRLTDRFMARAYQKGYDKIKLLFDNSELMKAIKDKVPELLGFEILKQGDNFCEVEMIASSLNVDFEQSLRRAFLIVLEMADDCFKGFKFDNKNILENVKNKDLDVNRFCYFCLREINKGRQSDFGNGILYYLIESLEDVGDEYKALAKNLLKIKKSNDLLKIIKETNNLTKNAYEFFYNPKKELAVKGINHQKETRKEIKKLYQNKNANEIEVLNCLDFILRNMYHFPTMRLDTLKQLSGKTF